MGAVCTRDGDSYTALGQDDRPPDSSNSDAKFQLTNEVQAYAALAVVSGLMGGVGLASLRSEPKINISTMGTTNSTFFNALVLISTMCAIFSTFTALYAAMVFSLLRYYGHAALARNRAIDWNSTKSKGCLARSIRVAFWCFVLSIFFFLLDLFTLMMAHCPERGLGKEVIILLTVFAVIVVIGFGITMLQILRGAAVIFMPRTDTAAESLSRYDKEDELELMEDL
eukprot:TRINITY_DN107323_c0_g1_i1.p1 TRINITY_DN107323_c0_g1~~TRINITY_DN107323_c0_g1_i1.p1  ORF type:complete len:226 (-),score=28.79 TRINITY_DN107323_c0_g1_i1:70-747(-)